jgi:tRNA pseudouridine55 synthase
MDGILIVDKPAGITSHDVVARVRRILRTKRVGHTGTLDPFATGVVVILVGKATRLAQFLDKDAKEYDATVQFGFETDTGDLTGQQKNELRITNYELRIPDIEAVLNDFRGEILQTPPMYSAKKIEGQKLYELARKGIEIERQAVKVNIYELRITNYELQEERITLRVVCSAGTYIRTLAEDIGRKLEVGAHLAALRRTRAGKFDLSKAVSLEKLEEIVSESKLDEILVSMNEAISHLPEVKLSNEEVLKVKNGMQLKIEDENLTDSQTLRLTDTDDNLVAIAFYESARKIIQPKTVLL